jgi:3'-phosphoadenosine 5'-phosphosulfate sulfotransferase (PAPS reductase)/FAD synthetase
VSGDRLEWLKRDAMRVVHEARQEYFHRHEMVAAVILMSGGNDSNILAHMMRPHASHIGMANTGIGVEETREHVRKVGADWQMPLIERSPKQQDSYEAFVTKYGFPGPGQHNRMYQRLKERCFEQIRSELVPNGRKQRVLFFSGRRRDESNRRKSTKQMDRKGSMVFCAPLINWTNDDMALYRRSHNDVPHNEVTDHLHMSGECLCGAYASPGELDLIRMFYRDTAEDIDALAAQALANGVKPKRCRWGWGAYEDWDPDQLALWDEENLCDSCPSWVLP